MSAPPEPHAASSSLAWALAAPRPASAASEVATSLLEVFTSGDLAPGSRLPAERQLAQTLNVGRSAVREALAALEILGVVTVRPGSGTYLRGTASELLPDTLRWGLLIGERSTRDLLQMRSGLEIFVARLAAGSATPDHLAALTEGVTRMRRAGDAGDFQALAEADLHFHQTLGEIVGNPILSDLLQVARSLLRVYADRSVTDAGSAARAADEHEAVLEAVRRRDPDAAASAMAHHMETASSRVLADERR